MVELPLESGANLKMRNKHGNSALDEVVSVRGMSHQEVVRLLRVKAAENNQ